MITVVACPHPLRTAHQVLEVEVGATVEDIVVAAAEATGRPLKAFARAVVALADRLVPKAQWKHTRPKDATTVVVKVTAAEPISLSIAVAGWAASTWVGTLSLTALQIGLIQAGIGLATALLTQMFAPTPKQHSTVRDPEQSIARFSIQGTRNEARPYGTPLKVYGRRVNHYPLLAALPYTEIFYDDTQYIRMLFDVGYGPLAIGDIKIGDTPIGQFPGMSYEVRQGYSSDAAITLFPAQVREEALSIELKYVSGFSLRRTEPGTDEASLDINFPLGLRGETSRGAPFFVSVQFEAQYRAVGSATWLPANLYSEAGNVNFQGGGRFSVSAKSKSAVRRSVRFVFPTRGQYDVQVRRLTVDDQSDTTGEFQSRTNEQSFWTAIRSFRNDAPVTTTGFARIAVRAQATNSLNGTIEQLNCTVTSILPVWTGSTWVEQATRNPAWAFCDVLRGSANKRPLADSRLDLVAIKAWADWCDANGFTFDGVIDRRMSVYEALQEIAGTACASPTIIDGRYSVVVDNTRSTVVQHFTPRNLRGFKITQQTPPPVHAIKVIYYPESTQHQAAEILVYYDGYSDANATLFETIELPYTTSAAAAWKRGRRALFAAILRNAIYEAEADIEHLICNRGDLVRVTHDVPMWGLGAARVSALVTSGSDTTGIVVDMPLTMAAASYAVRIRQASSSAVYPINTVAGEQTTLTFATPVATASGPAVGDLVLFGELGQESVELLVRSIEPGPDLTARLSFIDYAPAVQTSDTGTVPVSDPQITVPPAAHRARPPSPYVVSIDSDEGALIRASDGTLTSRILIGVALDQSAGNVAAEIIQARYRPADSTQDWTFVASFPAPAGTASIMPVEDGAEYEIEFRSVAQAGATSEWIRTRHTVVGKTTPPPAVERFYRVGNTVTAPYPDPPIDLAGFRFRANYGTSTDWGAARPLHDGLMSTPTLDISQLSGTQTVMVKPVDTSGIEATTAPSVTLDLGDLPVSNVVETQSEAPDWTGTLTGGTDTGTDIEADLESSAPMYGPAAAQLYGAAGEAFYEGNYYAAMSYVARYTPDTLYLGDGLLKLELTVTGDYVVDYRISTSPAFYGASGDPLYGSADDPFYAESEVGEWAPWPGVLGPFETVADTYDVRITTAAGATQGVVSQMDLITDLPDIVETLDDVVIAAASTRLPITKTYRAIKVVNLTVQTDGSGGISARIIDKSASLGPDIEVLNAAGTAVDGLVDAYIQGY